jgi:uncharacterized protein (DUF1778 family)
MKEHHSEGKKSERFEARLQPQVKAILRRAADIQGSSSLADFIVACAHREATRIIKDNEVISLSERDQKLFIESYFSPPTLPKEALKAAQDYKSYLNTKTHQ